MQPAAGLSVDVATPLLFQSGGGLVNGRLNRTRRSQSVTAEAIAAALESSSKWPPSGAAPPIIAEETPKSRATELPAVLADSRRAPLPQYRRRSSVSSINCSQQQPQQPVFAAPTTPEQLLRAIQSVEVLESQSDWALVSRPNGATFWINRRTGQFRPQAPNSVYRDQATEAKNLQARIVELEAELRTARVSFGKWKGDRERMDNESLMPELAEKTAQLVRLEHSHEKLKVELAKNEDQLRQKEADLRRRLKQMQSLEEKGHRVDDLTAEVAKLNEKISQLQQQLRDKDYELSQSLHRLQTAETEAQSAKLSERKSQDRVAGLTDQLRFEATRSAELDERLVECAEAAESRDRLLAENRRLAELARDAELLTSAARREQRQLADRLAAANAECRRLRALLPKAESKINDDSQQLEESAASVRTDDAAVSNGEVPEAADASTTSAAELSRISTSNSFSIGSVKSSSTDPATESSSVSGASDVGGRARAGGNRSSRQLRERLVGLHIHLGDRVALRAGKQLQLAPGAKLQRLEAVVKYIGQPPGQKGVRYGVKLLNKTAVSRDGVASSADPAAADFRSDLLVRAKQIEGVFSQKTNSYKTLDSLISEYLEMH